MVVVLCAIALALGFVLPKLTGEREDSEVEFMKDPGRVCRRNIGGIWISICEEYGIYLGSYKDVPEEIPETLEEFVGSALRPSDLEDPWLACPGDSRDNAGRCSYEIWPYTGMILTVLQRSYQEQLKNRFAEYPEMELIEDCMAVWDAGPFHNGQRHVTLWGGEMRTLTEEEFRKRYRRDDERLRRLIDKETSGMAE